MIYRKLVILFLVATIVYLCSSCNRKVNSNRYAKETEQFNSYLQEHFTTSLPSDSSTFVLLSTNGCSGCVKSFLKVLTRPAPANSSAVHYIVPNKLLIKDNIDAALLNKSVMIDMENRVDRLPYHNGNIAIIESADGMIYNLYKIEPYQTDSVLTILNK